MSYKQKSEISHSFVGKWPSKNKGTRDASVGRSNDYVKFLAKQGTQCSISSNIALLIMQEILQSHFFLMSRKFKTQNCQWFEVKQIKSIFAEKWDSETRFGAPVYYLK